MEGFIWFILALTLWRVSNLVANESGPAHSFKRFRIIARGLCIFGPRFWRWFHFYELVSCEYCNSVWLGTPLAIAYHGDLSHEYIPVLVLSWSASVIMFKHVLQMLKARERADLAS